MALSETGTRVLVAAIGIPVALGAVYGGGWILASILIVIAVLIALEFFRLGAQKSALPLSLTGSAAAAGYVVLAALDPSRGPDAAGFALLLVASTLVITTASIWTRGVAGQPLLSVCVTVTGSVYAGALLSFALFLRHLPGVDGSLHGAALLFAPLLLTWVSDTCAYFAGRRWGTRKLIPAVSPGKTVQGAVGAVIGATCVAIVYGMWLTGFSTYQLTVAEAGLLGLLVSVTAQLGDLAESLFKRDAGVKDSGNLLPGHGGALDRFDSLLYTLPIGYLFFHYFVGAGPF